MDNKEISLIFNEKAKEVFNSQEEKYSRRRKYTGLYCCSEDEVIGLEKTFAELLEIKEDITYQKFSEIITKEGLEGE